MYNCYVLRVKANRKNNNGKTIPKYSKLKNRIVRKFSEIQWCTDKDRRCETMIYKDFKELKLSLLGFGTMRLPQNEDGSINEEHLGEMVKCAIDNGVSYFDTAYPYHGGESERAIGRALNKYPRDTYYLATKFPGHQISSSYNPEAIFEEQLEKCGVDYFDFYLLHNVYENSIKTYMDSQWGIIEYFKKQKELGRIKHLGFSCHGSISVLKEFLDYCGGDMEFCQIQLNYLDWTLQDAKGKYELLTERGIPVWVMEPVRGGKLASLDDEAENKLRALRPEESVASWGFRFLQELDNVHMVLSGMSDISQVEDNLKTFGEIKPLSEQEMHQLLEIADGMKDSVPCTACRYCTAGCPMNLDIPVLIEAYNNMRFSPDLNVGMRIEGLDEDKRPQACIKCGACAAICPQSINIPDVLSDLSEKLTHLPSWAEICRMRDEASKKNK